MHPDLHGSQIVAWVTSELQLRASGLRRMLSEPGERLSAQGLAFGRGQSRRVEAMAVVQPRELLQRNGVRSGFGRHPRQPFDECFRFVSCMAQLRHAFFDQIELRVLPRP